MPHTRRDKSFQIGLLLISAATLLYELDLTRLFSISEWGHYAFLVVSLAMLGFGAGGTLLATLRLNSAAYLRWLPALALLFGASVVGSYLFANYVPFDSFSMALQPSQFARLAGRYAALSLPFFFSGSLVTAMFMATPEKAGTLYFWNLLGSGVGPSLLLILIPRAGAGGVPFVAAGLGFTAASLFAGKSLCVVAISLLAAFSSAAAGFVNLPLAEVKMSPYKRLSYDLQYPGARKFARASTATALINVLESPGIRWAPGLSFAFGGTLPPQMGLYVDGSLASSITKVERSLEIRFLDFLPSALPYGLKARPRVLIIQPRGGLEVLCALALGAAEVTVIEPEPALPRLMKSSLADFTAGLYSRENVRVVTAGARSFARRTGERFDVVAVPISEEIGLVTQGAFSLSEDYVYTVEGMRDLLGLLDGDGVLAVTRWLQAPPTELLRAAGTIAQALEQLEAANPAQNLAAIRTLSTVTLLAKRDPIRREEAARILSFCDRMQFEAILVPPVGPEELSKKSLFLGENLRPLLGEVLEAGTRKRLFEEYEYDVRPCTDDRPFFANFFRWGQLPAAVRLMGKRWLPYAGSGYLFLLIVLALGFVLTGVLIMAPAAVLSRRPTGAARFLPYFFLLGSGFMALEISLMHHFILFLDHPTYAFSAVMGALLVFSGAGSLISERLPQRLCVWLLPAITGISMVYAAALHPLFSGLLGLPLPARAVLSLIALAPLGLLMGMPFPAGLKLASARSPLLIPWAWATNGAASVLASIAAIMICLTLGYSRMLLIGGGLYLLSFVSGLTLLRGSRGRT